MEEKTVLLKDQFDEACKKYKINRSPWKNSPKSETDTGFLKTRKIYCQSCKKKYTYRYRWFDIEENKYKVISNVDLRRLRDRVKERGLEWEVDSYYKARKTAKEVGLPLRDLK